MVEKEPGRWYEVLEYKSKDEMTLGDEPLMVYPEDTKPNEPASKVNICFVFRMEKVNVHHMDFLIFLFFTRINLIVRTTQNRVEKHQHQRL